MTTLLTALLRDPHERPFALLNRGDKTNVEVLAGRLTAVESIAEIPIRVDHHGPDVLAAIPFRQIGERGFECHDDNAPLLCLIVDDHEIVDVSAAVTFLPAAEIPVSEGRFVPDDDTYSSIVDRIIQEEIGAGAGANFVIRRDYRATTSSDYVDAALTIYRQLLQHERGAYWTFAFINSEVALVGATPERHVSAHGLTVFMNPISGTYRHPDEGPTTSELLRFLDDSKETDELFMVVDEELKMMSGVCERGGRVLGPFLKEMEHLTHTEYLLEGQSTLDVREILRKTMFAPTVTGSPIENAARVITRYETGGRGYYSGVLSLIGHDDAKQQTLDAPILIRTCEISPSGAVKASVGATLVRGSSPQAEVAETHAKLGGVLAAIGSLPRRVSRRPDTPLADLEEVGDALRKRNRTLARFWMEKQEADFVTTTTSLTGRTALIVNLEDEWTSMLAHQLRHFGMKVSTQRWDALDIADDIDLVIAGPGPGDPRDASDPRIAVVETLLSERLSGHKPIMAICLSHQVLSRHLGFPIERLPEPNQGTQKVISLFGEAVTAGFYNTFVARDRFAVEGVDVSADESGAIHALRGPGFASVQFHPESILTTDGIDLLQGLACSALSLKGSGVDPMGESIDCVVV